MQEITLTDLIAQTKEALKVIQYQQSTLIQYEYGWRKLHNYFSSHGSTQFSNELANQFIKDTQQRCGAKEISPKTFQTIRKAVTMLIQYQKTGTIQWKKTSVYRKINLRTSSYIDVHDSYVEHLKMNNCGEGTIRLHKNVSKKFLSFLETEKMEYILNANLETIRKFILFAAQDYQPTSMSAFCTALRSFLNFLSLKNLISIDLTRAIPNHFARKTTILPVISVQEEEQLLAAIDRASTEGKRDYAIILLALRLGIRSVDIVNLKQEHIQWQRNVIEFIQQKTKSNLIVPLLADVGNAIVDYLLYARPDVPSPYVFLRIKAPYTKFSGHSSVYSVVSKYMKKANIHQSEGERKGAHCLRHTVASRLLLAETPITIISSVLGHTDKDAAKVYLSTNLEDLRGCSLGLSGFEMTKEALIS